MKYEEMPFKEWDGKTPLCLFDDDKFFFDQDDIEQHLEDLNYDIENSANHIKSENLQLVIGSPNHLWQLDFNDIYCDIIPEDRDIEDVVSKDVLAAFDKLNELISKEREVSYSHGKFRTTVTL